MKISSVSLDRAGPFFHTEPLNLNAQITVVVGPNNSGKSALLKALSLVGMSQHASPDTKQRVSKKIEEKAETHVELVFSNAEILEALDGMTDFSIPVGARVRLQSAVDWLRNSDQVRVHASIDRNGFMPPRDVHTIRDFLGPDAILYRCCPKVGGTWQDGGNSNSASYQDLGLQLCMRFISKVHQFKAERVYHPACPVTGALLAADGSNIAGVLAHLQGSSRTKYTRLENLFLAIFPELYFRVSIENNNARVMIGRGKIREEERGDLEQNLADCGVGVSQVLSILYLVVTAVDAVVLLDEPTNYLHPSALRALVRIIKDSNNQFVIASNSSELLWYAQPCQLVLLRQEQFQSTVEVIEEARVSDLCDTLRENGLWAGDIVGFKRVLWVEGPTEESVIPLVLDTLGIDRSSIGIKSVAATGDFTTKRDRQKILAIYRRLSELAGTFVPKVSFLFDAEVKSKSEKEDLQREAKSSGMIVEFIPERCIENCLFVESAMNAVLISTGVSTTEAGRKAAFVAAQNELKKSGDGAKAMSDFFDLATGSTCEYQKIKHGRMLAEAIVANDKKAFESLRECLEKVVGLRP